MASGKWGRFTEQERESIAARYQGGERTLAIAKDYGCSRWTILEHVLKPMGIVRVFGGKVGGATHHLSLEERFWLKVDKRGPDDCWPWKGAQQKDGHGMMTFKKRGLTAVRASWIIHFGEIPEDRHIDHRCQNPNCVNPAHLRPVTQRVNLARKRLQAKRRAEVELLDSLVPPDETTAPPLTVELTGRARWIVSNQAKLRDVSPEEFITFAVDSLVIALARTRKKPLAEALRIE